MFKKTSTIIILIVLLLIGAGLAYWYFFLNSPGSTITVTSPLSKPDNSFTPFGRPTPTLNENNASSTEAVPEQNEPPETSEFINGNAPRLRLLSGSPVGGYGASTTASTTVVRWVDRGRGNIYEARYDSPEITTLSNTILPRVYNSLWNKNLTAFIGSLLPSNSDAVTTVYAGLVGQKISSTTDSTNETAYGLKGRNLPDNMIDYAISPRRDKVFMFIKEENLGVGYIANFDGTKVTRIFDTPITQANVDWPAETTLTLTTKGLSSQAGFLYFINTKTGSLNKILGPIRGLSTRTSPEAKYVLYSSSNGEQGLTTNILTVKTGSTSDAIVRTLADKCAWGQRMTDEIYCAVPSTPVYAAYPDDWYRGTLSFVDKIWQIDAPTSEVHLVTTVVDQSDRVIDAFNLSTDTEDNYLFFMNKNDLSLWSFELN